MATALLDVNVLIAIFDTNHQYHILATQWFTHHIKNGNRWASCPITQNGCVRILSTPSYVNGFNILTIKQYLQQATTSPHHEFWQDNISLLDDSLIDWTHITGNRQLTDIYLMALAHVRQGVLVTLDSRVQLNSLKNGDNKRLIKLLN